MNAIYDSVDSKRQKARKYVNKIENQINSIRTHLVSRPRDINSAQNMLNLTAQRQDILTQLRNPEWAPSVKKVKKTKTPLPPKIFDVVKNNPHIKHEHKTQVFRRPAQAHPSSVRYDVDFPQWEKRISS